MPCWACRVTWALPIPRVVAALKRHSRRLALDLKRDSGADQRLAQQRVADLMQRLRWGLIAGVGVALAAGIMIGFSHWSATPLWLVPFATSIVLVIAAPDSPQAQPRNIVGGHVMSCLAGNAVLWGAGSSPALAAAAAGLSVTAMILTRTLHPPAGINGILIVANRLPLSFVVVPVASGAAVLVAFAYVFHRLAHDTEWPRTWW